VIAGNLKITMGIKEGIMEKWTLAAIVVVAILWRLAISVNNPPHTIALWESVVSGISLFIMGWALFAYLYSISLKATDWLISNKVAQGIAVSLSVLNIYVLVYYGMRWFNILHEEALLEQDYIFRNIRYVMLVLCYCAVIWSAKYLKKMHDNYMLLTRPEMRKGTVRTALIRVITDERTVIVLIGIAFLWRAYISLDKVVAPWESMVSCIGLFIAGWVLFGYVYSLSIRVRGRFSMAQIYHGIAIGLLAVNVYVIACYALRWYNLLLTAWGEPTESLVPLDFIFRDVRFLMLVIFYSTAIVLSKYLERATDECMLLTKKE
jgi:hypothetical protein